MLLAIDPGSEQSAYVLISKGLHPIEFDIVPNRRLRLILRESQLSPDLDHAVIEQIGHYGTGMPAGRDVFDTCMWIGRFMEILVERMGPEPGLIKRATIKAHHCGSAKADDGNVIQALVDRFATSSRNHGKGSKDEPDWFHGFRKDIWQAYALAVYQADKINGDDHD